MKDDDRGSDSSHCSVAEPLTFGSLFAGIGGIDLGFERAGMVCKWQVEIDEYANRVLAKHWPNVHRERDIRNTRRNHAVAVAVARRLQFSPPQPIEAKRLTQKRNRATAETPWKRNL